MSTAQILGLGAVAGLTIFIGLPIGRMHGLSAWLKCFLSSTATGILLFLLWDVLSAAVDPVDSALKAGGAELGLPRPARPDRRRADLPRHGARPGMGERGPVRRRPGPRGRVDPLRRDGAPERQPRLRVEDAGDARDPARARAGLRDGLHPRRGGRVAASTARSRRAHVTLGSRPAA